jgi:phosphoribosylformylglycinamidine synthase II
MTNIPDLTNLYTEVEVSLDTALELGLTKDEYNKITEIMGRTPTYTELGVYSVMWSEHCSYKNSIKQLKTLPRSGGRLLVEAGEENAGLVDIGDGYAIAFKIESHNHPSAIEPFQGAATGVGGILRDIFTMGARPIAALNSLRFGDIDGEGSARIKYLLRGVVEGISHYGNSFGVPTVGGEVYFEKCYEDNPLVNAMAVGIVNTDKTASAASAGVGNPVMILGSRTGRDGIHGASLLASREFDEKTDDMRPTVQVGDPFAEKLLLEATLELIESGVVVGIQDMGAAGISCSSSEMSAAKEKLGMTLDLDKVPLREADMSAYEIMLSESQERMLAVIEKGKEQIAYDICNKWDVPITHIGEVTDTQFIDVTRNGRKVSWLNANSLVLGGGAPQYDREAKNPKYLERTQNFDFYKLELNKKDKQHINEAFEILLKSPNIASKKWVFEQYDSQVRTNTVNIKGDAAVIRIKELPGKAIAVTTDCNSKYVYLNPYQGTVSAVAESARNVVCTGAKPVAITNCLNYGNPYEPEVYWQFKESIKGMGDACRELDTPVTGGNVSFHNESKNNAIYPTPTIGMLGIIDDLTKVISYEFKNEDDLIYLIGNNLDNDDKYDGLGGSEYLKYVHNEIAGDSPKIDIKYEHKLQNAILDLINERLLNSAHDISEGGLAICLAEKSINKNNLGCEIKLDDTSIQNLFGEFQSAIVVTINPENAKKIEGFLNDKELKYVRVGKVIKDKFKVNDILDYGLKDITVFHTNSLENKINS